MTSSSLLSTTKSISGRTNQPRSSMSFSNLTLFSIGVYLLLLVIGGTHGQSDVPSLDISEDLAQIIDQLNLYKSLIPAPRGRRSWTAPKKSNPYCEGKHTSQISRLESNLGRILKMKTRARRSPTTATNITVNCCDFSKQIESLLCDIKEEREDLDFRKVLYHGLYSRATAKVMNDQRWTFNHSSSVEPNRSRSKRSHRYRHHTYTFKYVDHDMRQMCRQFPANSGSLSMKYTRLMMQLPYMCKCVPVPPAECSYSTIRIIGSTM